LSRDPERGPNTEVEGEISLYFSLYCFCAYFFVDYDDFNNDIDYDEDDEILAGPDVTTRGRAIVDWRRNLIKEQRTPARLVKKLPIDTHPIFTLLEQKTSDPKKASSVQELLKTARNNEFQWKDIAETLRSKKRPCFPYMERVCQMLGLRIY
jgi:hypothetical protein